MSNHEPEPLKDPIDFDHFNKVDIRAATIIDIKPVEDLRSPCYKFTLDLGHLGTRICVGQFALLSVSELLGKTVTVVANMPPRKMKSHVSEVLMLGFPHPDSPENQDQATPFFAHNLATPGLLGF